MTRSSLVIATFAVLGFSVATITHAQGLSLNNGDNVTVSGTGTVGIIGGLPVSNATTSYDDTFATEYAVQTQGTAAFTLASGGTLTAGDSDAGLYINNGSGIITVTGGILTAGYSGIGLADDGSSPVNITGGTFSAGMFGLGLASDGSGIVSISGGTFSAGQYGAAVRSVQSGSITISGGTFSAAQSGVGLDTLEGGTINLFSLGDTPFLINGVSMNNTTLGQYTSGMNTISGILLDGETLNTTFYNGGMFNLNVGPVPAPEPSPIAAFAVGVLALDALALRARRRPAA